MRSQRTVVVFGSTSYVAGYVMEALLNEGYDIVAVTRNPAVATILLSRFHGRVRVCRAEALAEQSIRAPQAIINFAYPRDAAPYELYAHNKRLARLVAQGMVETRAPRLIHISTQAVFGYAPSGTAHPGPVSRRWADPYLDSKVQAEQLLTKHGAGRSYVFTVLRLGNVIGPGSPAWIARLAQRILEGGPVGYKDELGCSNAASIRNISDYLCFMTRMDPDELRTFGTYHHLAEFHSFSWKTILDSLAKSMGTKYILLSRTKGEESSGAADRIAAHLKRKYRESMGRLVRQLCSPVSGIPSVREVLERVRLRARASGPHMAVAATSADERTLFGIMGSHIPFVSHTLPGWSPRVSLESSLEEIGSWLQMAGYAVSAR